VCEVKTKLDPGWHKARVAARILLKARRRPLNARDRRLARLFADDGDVSNRLIEQGLAYWVAPYRTGPNGEKIPRVCHVVV
jgi:endonuclease YncB( thermonuclease family)